MKLKKPILILLIFLMLFLCISSVSALENQTDDSGGNGKISISENPENQTDDSGGNGKIGISESPKISNASNGTYTDLAARIADAIANNGSVLYLPYNFAYNEETDYKYNHYVYPNYPYYGILINETLTINGNNHTISGSNVARIFTINATDGVVTLNNITFADSAGAINSETDLSVNDCTFINNAEKYQIGSWGAINGCGGDITVTNSTFVNNSAIKGGAIHVMQTDITTITGSVFTNNTATGMIDGPNACGGAIYANGGLKLNIDNCTFTNNTAIVGDDTSWGGAIDAFYETVISNSKFNNNSAGFGGALDVVGNSANPDTIVISNNTFTNNIALEYGGAIHNLEENMTIQSCIFDGNKAHKVGTIFNNERSLLYLSNNTISSTKAEIYNEGDITSTSYVTVLENKTVKAEYGQTATLNATHIDDNGNLIYDTNLDFTVYGVDDPIPSIYADGIYTATYRVDKIEEKIVSVNLGYVTIYEGLLNISPSNATTVIFAPNLTKYYKGSERFTATVTDGKGQATPNKTVNITLNGVTYSRTTGEDGTVKLNINLNSGEYPVIVAADDVTVNSTITVEATIGAMNLVKVYGDDNTFNVQFSDANGNDLETTTVFFNVNGVIYNRTTGFEGDVEMDINLNPGEYIITSINPVTGEKKSNTIKVISTIESSDLTKYYKNDSQFVVRLLNEDGSYALEGQEVKFNINGIFYTRTTNATGHAKLNINLDQGNYIVTTYYKNCSQGNNIEVLPILGADDLAMKYMDGSQFKAKLVDGQGNPYPNQNVTFNINGVLYNRTTNSAGVAKLNIRLMPGEYIITSSYNGSNIANKITVKS
ncbi:MAG: hypothetical protein K6A34_00215 [Methanobrevibacter sp.]|nr:hypothetical protein [Methanobrevibacter sp.]